MEDAQAHRNSHAKKIRDVLGVGTGGGKIPGKVQVKHATTPAGAMAHVAKDSRKNFRFKSSTGLTLLDFHRLETEHRARNRGGFNGEGAVVKRADIVLFARQQVELHNEKLLDFTVHDWLLRLLQSKEARLHDHFVCPSSGRLDVGKIAAFQQVCWQPEDTTERLLFEVMEGTTDRSGSPWRNFAFDQERLEVVDPGLVSGRMFNPKHRNLSLGECLDKWDEEDAAEHEMGPPVPGPPAWPTALATTQLRRWQATLDTITQVPEDALLGRDILWVWEEVGEIGKSVFATCLKHRRRALIIKGSEKDILCVVSQFIIANGEAPLIIVVDLSRSDDKTPWAAIESIKNGEISSGKCHSTVDSFRRPHVVVLANRPADNVGIEISRDRVVEVEAHRFIEELEGAPIAPKTINELRTFPGVKTFAEVAEVAELEVVAEVAEIAEVEVAPSSPARPAIDVSMRLGNHGPVAQIMVGNEAAGRTQHAEDEDEDDSGWTRESPHSY